MTKSQIPNPKKILARARFVRQSPRKLRLIAAAIRGKTVAEAISVLKVLPQRAAKSLLSVYQQAVGNAGNNNHLVVTRLEIGTGPKGPARLDIHAHGARFDRGLRRRKTSHIILELASHGTKN